MYRAHPQSWIGTSINTNTLNANWEIICLPLDPIFTIIFTPSSLRHAIGCRTSTSMKYDSFHRFSLGFRRKLWTFQRLSLSKEILSIFIWVTCYNFNATTERMKKQPNSRTFWSILIGFLVSLSKYSDDWSLKTMQFNKTQTNRLYGRKWSKTWTTNGNFDEWKTNNSKK